MPRASTTQPAPPTLASASELDEESPSQEVWGEDDFDLGFVELDDTEDKLNVLYYGREGSGKTSHLAAMANLPTPGRVLIINAEGGLKRRALQLRGIDTSRIVVWPRPGEAVTFNGLTALHRKIKADLDANPDAWAGVGFDSITEVATALREQVTERRQDSLRRRGREFDPDLSDVSDYGTQTDQVKRILRRFRDLPCHFVATALERIEDNGQIGPDLGPSLANAVLGYVDFVLYCKATLGTAETTSEDETPVEFRAATRPGLRYRAKDRFDITPRVLANPDFLRVWLYVNEELSEETDAAQSEFNARMAQREARLAEERAERDARKAAARSTRKKA